MLSLAKIQSVRQAWDVLKESQNNLNVCQRGTCQLKKVGGAERKILQKDRITGHGEVHSNYWACWKALGLVENHDICRIPKFNASAQVPLLILSWVSMPGWSYLPYSLISGSQGQHLPQILRSVFLWVHTPCIVIHNTNPIRKNDAEAGGLLIFRVLK